MNLGGRPTFGDTRRTIEAHLFDIEADWQGARVRLDFVAHMRGVRPFSSPDELVRQLAHDEAAARVILGRNKAGL